MSEKHLPVADPDKGYSVADPGLEEHIERFTDADEAAGNRAYRAILVMLAAVPVLSILFVLIYFRVGIFNIPEGTYVDVGPLFANAQHVALGVTLGLAILLIGLAAVQWARVLMDDTESVEERHSAGSDEETMAAAAQKWNEGVQQSGLPRRKLLGGAMLGAIGIVPIPAVVMLADLGPHPTREMRARTIERTIWEEGVVIVNDGTQLPLRPEDIELGNLVNAQPQNLYDLHGKDYHVEKAKASLIVVRMDPASIKIPESRRDWHVSGILAYSKICTHVGCPIALWERQTHHLLCPCHQSTFDLGDSGVVVFGPAGRSLPQLPIKVNEDGYLVARSDFTVPVGPSFFERDSRNDFVKGDS